MARNNPADTALRRQAIYLGLMANLTEEQAQFGLRLWDSAYAQARATAIIDFVAELATQLGLTPKMRHELRLGLYQALLKHDTGPEAPPTPMPGFEPVPAAMQSLQPGMGPPPYRVFSRVAEEILGGVRDDGHVPLHDFQVALEAELATVKLSADLNVALVQWARGLGPLLAFINAAEGQLALAVQALYVATCEALGPVAADRLLAQSITSAETTPEARKFSPRRFL